MPIRIDPKLIILDEPVAGTFATPSPIEGAGETEGREFGDYRPQFYFRALDDGADDEPLDLVLLFTNQPASFRAAANLDQFELQRGATNGVPSYTPNWTDPNDSDPGVALAEASFFDDFLA